MPTWQDFQPFIVAGLALGGVYALSGVGMVVLYRATGVLNLSFGAVGAMGAFLAWSLINDHGIPPGVAYVVCVAFGGIVTLAYGVLFGPPLLNHLASHGFVVVAPLSTATAEGNPLPTIAGLDWTRSGAVGEVAGAPDWLVVDAPGAIRGGRAEALIAEADTVIAPVLPSYFDEDSTRRFLKDIEDLKRIRKGKVGVHLIANRVRAQQKATDRLRAFFDGLGQEPVAWIAERAAYAELAEQGLAIFDRPRRNFAPLRTQWEPVLAAIG